MKKVILFATFVCVLSFVSCNTAERPPATQSPTTADSTSGTDALVAAQTAEKPNATIIKGSKLANAGTYTGLSPLPKRATAIAAPSSSLPTTRIEHAYGVAKNGLPHQISIDNQAFFDSNHFAAVAYDNVSAKKVIYLTFDCGYENGNTAKILDVLKEKQVPAAFFCTLDELKTAPAIVARMINEGHIVGNHSATHPSFAEISRTQMAQEIIESDNYLREHFGYSAPFFRFPKGEYTQSALDAVQSIGFTSVFWSAAYSDWDTGVTKGAQYAVDTVTTRLHPGAILLLHSVSADNANAMAQIIDTIRNMGYALQSLTALPLFNS